MSSAFPWSPVAAKGSTNYASTRRSPGGGRHHRVLPETAGRGGRSRGLRRQDPNEVGVGDLVHKKENEDDHDVCLDQGKLKRPEEGGGSTYARRKPHRSSSETASHDGVGGADNNDNMPCHHVLEVGHNYVSLLARVHDEVITEGVTIKR